MQRERVAEQLCPEGVLRAGETLRRRQCGLRELALHGAELSVSVIARRTGVTQQSVRNVLGSRPISPLIRTYGQGRAASYRLDAKHPLARILTGLFEAEDHRARDIQNQIRAAAERFDPAPLAVWMFGSVARGEDQPLSDVDLLLVVRDDSTAERDAGLFRQEMDSLAKAHGITISVVPASGRDVCGAGRISRSRARYPNLFCVSKMYYKVHR